MPAESPAAQPPLALNLRCPFAAAARTASPAVRALLLLAALWLAAIPAGAASESALPLSQLHYETWSTRDGLPHNTINAIAQSPDGYLWLATWEGLVRFSGRSFRNFDRGSGTGLPDSGVRALLVDPQGRLLAAGSRGGVVQMEQGRWQSLPAAPAIVASLLRDRSGQLWAGTEGSGLMLQETDGEVRYFSADREAGGGSVYALAEDGAGRIWVGSSRGLKRVEGDLLVSAHDPEDRLGQRRSMALLVERDGHLLVGTERGLFRSNLPLDGVADPDLRFHEYEPGLAGQNVTALLRDHRGHLWVGTVASGLYRISARGLEHYGQEDGLPNSRILALFEDREHSLWIGTNGGLVRMAEAPFSSLTRRRGLSDNFVRSVLPLRDGRLAVGTARGLNFVEGERVLPPAPDSALAALSVLSLAEGREGLWVGTYTDGALRVSNGRIEEQIDSRQGLPSNEVRALLESADGRLWVGTTQGLFERGAAGTRSWRMPEGLPNDYVISLFMDSRGALHVGTGNGVATLEDGQMRALALAQANGAQAVFQIFEEPELDLLWFVTDRGLVRLRRSDGSLTVVGMDAGLPFDKFFHAVDDGLGGLWLTGNRGVLRIERSALHAVADGLASRLEYEHFTESDGMASAQSNGGSSPAAGRSRDGRVWVATSLGLATVDPAELARFAQQPPPVVIESVMADGADLALAPAVVIPAGTTRIEIGFVGLTHVMPQRLRYRYRLEGLDADWVERTGIDSAVFTNLRPGRHVFLAQAAQPDGVWSLEAARMVLDVVPQPWQRIELQVLAGLALMILIGGLLSMRLRRLRAGESRLRELVDERTAQLRQQADRLQAADADKNRLMEALREQAAAFEQQAREDALTGLANRRAFDELLAYEFTRAARNDQPLCVAMIDIDHFKRINDEHSHAVGDEVLRRMAQRMRSLCREVDTLARWGGEEFALLLPGTRLSDALNICERVRHGLDSMNLDDVLPGISVSVSIGLASHEDLPDHDRLLSQADAALYAAKQAGRNRVAC
ncbi:MAG: diguanylate cyclase [Aquimonas sp.]|nr:diguanylate cyclase [Aquimonas sp.]